MRPARGRYARLAPWAIGFSLLVLVVFVVVARIRGGAAAWDDLRRLDLRLLAGALAFHVAAHVLWGARLSLIAGGLGVPLQGRTGWRFVTAGVFGGAVTPGRVGGEAIKLGLLMRRGAPATQASRVLVADRSLDLSFFLVVGIVAAAVLPTLFGAAGGEATRYVVLGSAILAAFLLLLGLMLASPRMLGRALHRFGRPLHRRWPDRGKRIERFAREVRGGLATVYRRPGLLVAAIALTLLNWLAEYVVLWTLLRGFGHPLPYPEVFLIGAVLTIVSNIPVTPGGSGLAETAAAALLLPLAPGLTLLFPVVWRIVTYWYDLVVGGVVALASAALKPPRGEGGAGGETAMQASRSVHKR